MSGRNSDGYLVQIKDSMCSDCTDETAPTMCIEDECKKLCYHMYTCDDYCYDYTNGHLCKHIHRVHSLRMKSEANNDTCQYATSNNYPENESDSDVDDPLEFAENVRDLSTGILCH